MNIQITKPERLIDEIIIHKSDSNVIEHDDISIIRLWHYNRGFKDVGYHFFIKRNGEIQKGRDLNQIGAHAKGHNSYSVGICLSGKTEFTEKQFNSLAELIREISDKINIKRIMGHCDIDPVNKSYCPGFDVKEFLNKFQIIIR